MAGIFQPTGYVILKNLKLPEFDKNLSIDGQMAYVFDSPCSYQVIFCLKSYTWRHGTNWQWTASDPGPSKLAELDHKQTRMNSTR